MAYSNRKRYSRVNWGFLVVVAALLAAVAIVTFAKPLGLENVPTWEQLLEKPVPAQSTPEQDAPERDGGAGGEEPGVTVHMIDVGQGDSILIQTQTSNVLIDAGPPEAEQTVLAYLRAQGVKQLDLLVATHPHADHIGGMAGVVKRHAVERALAPEVSGQTSYSYEKLLETALARGLKFTQPQPGAVFDLGGAQLTVLGPVEPDAENMNNNSIVLRLDCGTTSFLFTGDLEDGGEDSLLASGADLEADVLKAGHHGSNTSTQWAFLDAVNPRWAAISCAWDNSYGHPHREVLRRLDSIGATVWRTDMDGTVVFTSDGTRISARSEEEVQNAA